MYTHSIIYSIIYMCPTVGTGHISDGADPSRLPEEPAGLGRSVRQTRKMIYIYIYLLCI